MNVSMVTSSTPMPMPVITRQTRIPDVVVWKAITTELAVYHNNEYVKIVRRPNLSAINPNANVPMKSPAKVADTKLASPVSPKNETEAPENSPLRIRPGPIYVIRKRS